MILALFPGISSNWSVALHAASGQLRELREQPVTILEKPVNNVTHDRNTLKSRMMSKWFDRQGCDYFLASDKALLFTHFELFSETK